VGGAVSALLLAFFCVFTEKLVMHMAEAQAEAQLTPEEKKLIKLQSEQLTEEQKENIRAAQESFRKLIERYVEEAFFPTIWAWAALVASLCGAVLGAILLSPAQGMAGRLVRRIVVRRGP
jgi:hypothetical protein